MENAPEKLLIKRQVNPGSFSLFPDFFFLIKFPPPLFVANVREKEKTLAQPSLIMSPPHFDNKIEIKMGSHP
ncbi:hypothetical protein BGS_0118 [Beggiatoa sp. SS]|nr:hypothetical protein BGS_0118 [Beggiatoa sp. SS]